MRIVSYNILNGGSGRVDILARVIGAARPDVVTLLEADSPRVVEALAARLEMTFLHAPSGGRHAGAILSRYPFEGHVNHALAPGGWMNAFLEARVIHPRDGSVWPVVAVHFAAHATEEREQVREAQLAFLFDRLAPIRNRPHVLAGDFNANAPSQQIVPANCAPRTRRDWEANGGGLPRRVVRRLLETGYLDTFQTANPGQANTTGTYTTEYPGQRIDYIFTRGVDPALVRAAWIDTRPPAASASDHFPIGVDLDTATMSH